MGYWGILQNYSFGFICRQIFPDIAVFVCPCNACLCKFIENAFYRRPRRIEPVFIEFDKRTRYRDRRSECPYVTEDYILHLGRKLGTAIFGNLGCFPEGVHCIIVLVAFSLRLRDDIGFCGGLFSLHNQNLSCQISLKFNEYLLRHSAYQTCRK